MVHAVSHREVGPLHAQALRMLVHQVIESLQALRHLQLQRRFLLGLLLLLIYYLSSFMGSLLRRLLAILLLLLAHAEYLLTAYLC